MPSLAPTPYKSPYDTDHSSLRRQILRECEEMAEYAFASGLRVPAGVMQVVEAAVAASLKAKREGAGDEPYDNSGEEIKRLTQAHEQLAKVVAPATPRALVILADHRNDGGFWGALGPVPFIRHMMVVAGVSLLCFVVLVAVPFVDGDVVIQNVLKTVNVREPRWLLFTSTLANELFLITAAALGASFSALFQANRYIAERTYDPQHEISYWIKFVVGLMAGLILCLLVPINLGAEGSTADAMEKPLLALLGGFSASAVYRILNRLVETVESLVRGSTKEIVASAEEQARIRAQAEAEQMRLRMASSLLSIQQEIAGGTPPDQVKARLDGMLNGMIPDRMDMQAAPPPAAPAPPAVLPVSEVAPAPEPYDGADEVVAPAHAGAYDSEDESDGDDHDTDDTPATPAPVPGTINIAGIKPAAPPSEVEAVG